VSGPSALEKQLTSQLDGPLVVVTVTNGRERGGCVVGFHCQCSIEPGRFAIWLSKANHTYRVALQDERFAVHFLTEDDRRRTRDLITRPHSRLTQDPGLGRRLPGRGGTSGESPCGASSRVGAPAGSLYPYFGPLYATGRNGPCGHAGSGSTLGSGSCESQKPIKRRPLCVRG